MAGQITAEQLERYQCSYGCGNLFQFVMGNVEDSTLEYLCLPCLTNLAVQIIASVVGTEGMPEGFEMPTPSPPEDNPLEDATDVTFSYEEGV
jgi:hypothetical protein